MQITPKFQFVEGSFDTETNKMLCIASDNHGTVELCFKEEGCGWNIPFAEITLYDSGKYVDFSATMEDAQKLGNEIARRWNECHEKAKTQVYPRSVIGGSRLAYTDGVRDGIEEGKKQLLSRAMDKKTLADWYISSIDETVPPIWTEKHISELCKDFYVIPRENTKQ